MQSMTKEIENEKRRQLSASVERKSLWLSKRDDEDVDRSASFACRFSSADENTNVDAHRLREQHCLLRSTNAMIRNSDVSHDRRAFEKFAAHFILVMIDQIVCFQLSIDFNVECLRDESFWLREVKRRHICVVSRSTFLSSFHIVLQHIYFALTSRRAELESRSRLTASTKFSWQFAAATQAISFRQQQSHFDRTSFVNFFLSRKISSVICHFFVVSKSSNIFIVESQSDIQMIVVSSIMREIFFAQKYRDVNTFIHHHKIFTFFIVLFDVMTSSKLIFFIAFQRSLVFFRIFQFIFRTFRYREIFVRKFFFVFLEIKINSHFVRFASTLFIYSFSTFCHRRKLFIVVIVESIHFHQREFWNRVQTFFWNRVQTFRQFVFVRVSSSFIQLHRSFRDRSTSNFAFLCREIHSIEFFSWFSTSTKIQMIRESRHDQSSRFSSSVREAR